MTRAAVQRLFFLHGALGSAAEASWWQEHLPRWHVSAPALGIADDWTTEIDRLAGQLPGPAVLAGYSLGARLALGLAIRHPSAWQGLVLLSGNPGLVSDRQRAARWQADTSWHIRLQQQPMNEFLEGWYRQPVFAGDPRETIEQLIAEKRALDRQEALRILQTLSVARQPDYRGCLPTLQLPVLLLAGERDEQYVNLAIEMQALLLRATLRRISGAGHVLHRSHPAETFQAIGDFLLQLKDGH